MQQKGRLFHSVPSSVWIKCIRFVSVACFRGSGKEPRAVLVRAQVQGYDLPRQKGPVRLLQRWVVCLSVWVLICSRCMSGANCERESVTYSDGILMHPEKGNLHVERKSFPGVKRPSHEIHHSHVVPKMRMQWFVPRSHGEEFKYRAKFTTAAADLLTSKDWRSEISHIRESVLSRVNLEGGISAGAWPSIMSDSCKSCLGWCAPLSNFWVPLSK
jgi:hypothetical protein